jgi:subtilase family serine protease
VTAPAKTEAPAKTVAATTPAVQEGVDLAPGRVTVARSGSGGGIVKVGVANRGTEAGQGAQVLVLLDGVVAAEGTIGALDAGASGATELSLGSCPSGRHSLVVVVDPRGQVTEADERDNSSSSTVSFDC